MKNFFGKVLVGAVGCVMAFGISAFAANEFGPINITPNKETGTVTITGSITGDVAPESTILVVPDGQTLENLDDAQIKYIDQQTVQNGKFSYTFVLATDKKYDVYFGGTDVISPESGEIDLTAAADKYQIIGTVTLPGDASKVTAQAKDGEAVKAEAKANKDNGQYVLEVEPGTYDVVVGRAGYLYKTYANVAVNSETVTDGKKDLGTVALLAGDVAVSDPANISGADLQALLKAYNTTDSDEGFSAAADFNDDGMISGADLTILLKNYNMVAEDYDAE